MSLRPSSNAPSAGLSMQGPRVLLLLCVLGLVLIGLVMVYSASLVKSLTEGGTGAGFFTDQLKYAVAGVVLALLLWKLVPYQVWMSPAVWVVWGVAVALVLAVAVTGTVHNGAKRWLYIGSFGLQPSEFCKIAFLLVAVRIFMDYKAGTVELRAALIQAFLLIIVPVAIMYRTQSDLGTTVICAIGIVAVLWMGGVPKRVLLAVGVVGLVAVAYAVFGTDYRAGRMVFLDPWNDGKDGYGTGYNIIRSYYALSEGGLFGVGLGNSHEKFQYLFASESDFIFAVIGEELGLLGAMLVVGLFFGVLYAGVSIAERVGDDVGTMIAGGCTVMLVFQAFLNIACVIGVFPTTGKPLPFISAGGSSMVASFILLGLILSVSNAAPAPSIYEQRRADLRLVKEDRSADERPRRGRGEDAGIGGRASNRTAGRADDRGARRRDRDASFRVVHSPRTSRR